MSFRYSSAKNTEADHNQILDKLDRLEKLVRLGLKKCHGVECIEFEYHKPIVIKSPYKTKICNHDIEFRSDSPLIIKDYPVSGRNGLYFQYDLDIVVTPPCENMIIEVSNYASLSWEAYDDNGSAISSIPPSPAPNGISSHFIEFPGKVVKFFFKSGAEAGIYSICCPCKQHN